VGLFSLLAMTSGAPAWRLFLLLIVVSVLAGCSQFTRSSVEDEKDPHFIEGKNRAHAMDWDGAIESFERALQSNPRNAAAHLELGIIYESKKNDYIDAIYHYKRYLTLNTNSPIANIVKGYITSDTRELAKTVSYAVVSQEVQKDLERLSRTNSMLMDRVSSLETELSRRPQYVTNYVTNYFSVGPFENRASAGLTKPAVPVVMTPQGHQEMADSERAEAAHDATPEPAPKAASRTPAKAAESTHSSKRTVARETVRQSPREASKSSSHAKERETEKSSARTTHTVRPGETLAVLASKYGVSLKELKAANPSAAGGVRAGQKIIIPGK
jgi:LysM repeat protein